MTIDISIYLVRMLLPLRLSFHLYSKVYSLSNLECVKKKTFDKKLQDKLFLGENVFRKFDIFQFIVGYQIDTS